eukprot:45832-Chlamydomonas_euryale.AAC.1
MSSTSGCSSWSRLWGGTTAAGLGGGGGDRSSLRPGVGHVVWTTWQSDLGRWLCGSWQCGADSMAERSGSSVAVCEGPWQFWPFLPNLCASVLA